jgi:hypothetical protein
MGREEHRAEVRTPRRHARPVAAGGWRRAALGLGVGAIAGALLSRVLEGRQR